MTLQPNKPDQFGRPGSAVGTCSIKGASLTPTTGSVWPSPTGSDHPSLDIPIKRPRHRHLLLRARRQRAQAQDTHDEDQQNTTFDNGTGFQEVTLPSLLGPASVCELTAGVHLGRRIVSPGKHLPPADNDVSIKIPARIKIRPQHFLLDSFRLNRLLFRDPIGLFCIPRSIV